jgi:hypothetical protein
MAFLCKVGMAFLCKVGLAFLCKVGMAFLYKAGMAFLFKAGMAFLHKAGMAFPHKAATLGLASRKRACLGRRLRPTHCSKRVEIRMSAQLFVRAMLYLAAFV